MANPESSATPAVMAAQLQLDSLHVENFRALANVSIGPLTPLTVLIGPNGSGKSTLFDAMQLLADCMTDELENVFSERGHVAGVRTTGRSGPVVLELTCREPEGDLHRYRVAFEDGPRGEPIVASESLVVTPSQGRPVDVLVYARGKGVARGKDGVLRQQDMRGPDIVALDALGRLDAFPACARLRSFLTGWHRSQVSLEAIREAPPDVRPQTALEPDAGNLAGVIAWMQHETPDSLARIHERLRRAVPLLESVAVLPDNGGGRSRLRFRDVSADAWWHIMWASDGTLKLLALFVLFGQPHAPPVILLDEPENYLHPRLLHEMAETCREAATRSQILVATHSPYFLDGLLPEETWVMYRDEQGAAQCRRVADIAGVPEFMEAGALLGHLWMEGYFRAGDPLTRQGMPPRPETSSKREGGPREH